MRFPWVIAHRGASGHAPENTLAAFRLAVELGAHFIETDLHVTRDGCFVAIHDDTVDRTTNGTGEVQESSLEELRRVDAGLWFDRDFMGQRIPTLAEILEFSSNNQIGLYLELKYSATAGVEQTLAEALRKAHNAARVTLISFDPANLARLREIDASLALGLLVEENYPNCIRAALDVGARQFCPKSSCVTPELVEEAHRAELQVATWTVNSAETMRSMIAARVDGIMTDFPDRLRAVIEDLPMKRATE